MFFGMEDLKRVYVFLDIIKNEFNNIFLRMPICMVTEKKMAEIHGPYCKSHSKYNVCEV